MLWLAVRPIRHLHVDPMSRLALVTQEQVENRLREVVEMSTP